MFIHMFVLTIPWLEKVLRPIIVYFALIFLLRVFGKRELAQLNPFDLVVLLCLANTLQNAVIGTDDTVVGGLVGAFSLRSAFQFTRPAPRWYAKPKTCPDTSPVHLAKGTDVLE